MTKLRLASDLALPVDVASNTLLIVGKRGSGKSSTATRLAEQLIGAKVPIAVLDPADVWYGLKSSADGKSAGLDVYVFGGAHADVPLEPSAGALLADVLVDHRVNAVMVLREFSNRDKAHFVSDFADRLYRRMRGEFVMHLFCEEAHELMPQQPYGGEEEMLGRMLRLEKQGRTGGIGMSAITQRPASLNKNATTQAEILIAHRLLGPQDRAAIEGWIKYHHVEAQKQEVLATLPELKTGEAWVWSPDFPEDHPIGLRRVAMLAPETFDSRRTPKPGERRAEPKQFAPVDLERLRDKMAATIERAKADDPRTLRARIRELEVSLKRAEKDASVVVYPAAKRIEIPILKDGELRRIALAASKLERTGERLEKVALAVKGAAHETAQAGGSILALLQVVVKAQSARSAGVTSESWPDARSIPGSTVAPAVRATSAVAATTRPMSGADRSSARTTEGITPRQQRFLDAAATLETLGVEATRETVAAWLGIHPRGGSVGEELSALVEADLIEYERGRIVVSDAGRAVAGELPAHEAIDRAIHGISRRQQRVFQIIREAYPEPISRDAIAERMGIHPRGGSFGEDLGRLRGRGLIEYQHGQARARDFLFAGASR